MNKTVLITRPNHDALLNLLYHWTEIVVVLAKKKKFTVLDLKSQKSNKKDFDSYIVKKNPSLVFFNGHGAPNLITGHGNEPLIVAGKDESLLKDKIIYSRTCDSAAILGKKSVKKGTKAFIGYLSPFALPYSKSFISNPLRDNIARRFLEPTNLIPTTIIKGHTAGEADLRAKKEMYRNVLEMLSSISSFEEQQVAGFLWSNIASQTLIGDPTAKI